jgi:phage head maturation protease
LRKITGVKLYDVAPCTFPAYAGTSVSARAIDTSKDQRDEHGCLPGEYAHKVNQAALLLEQIALDEVS